MMKIKNESRKGKIKEENRKWKNIERRRINNKKIKKEEIT